MLSTCFPYPLPLTLIYCLAPPSLSMVGKQAISRSGAWKKKADIQVIDVEATETRNRRGARVYKTQDVATPAASTSRQGSESKEARLGNDGSKSPAKHVRPLSPSPGHDHDDPGSDSGYHPKKKLKRKTKVRKPET